MFKGGVTLQKFKVNGMSCAACSARVEKAVSSLSGVSECNVNLLTGDMTVIGNAKSTDIINAVLNAGYGIEQSSAKKSDKENTLLQKKPNKNVLWRLVFSAILLLVLMYFSMFHTMWGAPLPNFIAKNYLAQALIQL